MNLIADRELISNIFTNKAQLVLSINKNENTFGRKV
jgi:hypothetical protein